MTWNFSWNDDVYFAKIERKARLKRRKALQAKTGPRRSPIKKKVNRNGPPLSVRDKVHARSGGRCEIAHPGCTGKATQIHHRLMRSQGGRHAVTNLLDLCAVGHRYVHDNPALSYERGWLLRRHPLEEPDCQQPG
jgi:hypothetical protein